VFGPSESFAGVWQADDWQEGVWINHATGWRVEGECVS
jgi:hypothetical protein